MRIGETNGKKYGAAPPYAEWCFYDRTLCSDVSDSGSVIGKETSEMQTYALAKQLDADGFIWTQQDSVNHGYPFLEIGTEIPVCHVPDDLAANDGASIQSLHIQNLPGNTPGRWEWANGTETFTIDADTYDA